MAFLDGLTSVLSQELVGQLQSFLEALGHRWKLGLTDVRCLELLFRSEGEVTAGALGDGLRLSSGAVTQTLDRLEKAGWIARAKSEQDRRQVLVTLAPGRRAQLAEALEPMQQAFGRAAAGATLEELERLRLLATDMVSHLRTEVERMKGQDPQEDEREVRLRFSGRTAMGLEVRGGASHFELGPAAESLLVRVRAKNRPRVKEDDGRLVVDHLTGGFRIFGGEPARLELSALVTWALTIKGGVSAMAADLSQVPLSALEIKGGASELKVALPAPRGTVPLKLTGGAANIRFTRPPGTPVRLHLRGGASGLTLDLLEMGSVGGELKWQTPDYATAADRYDVELSGGAHHLALLS